MNFIPGNLADLESELKAEETLKAQCEQNLQDLAAKLGQKQEQVQQGKLLWLSIFWAND